MESRECQRGRAGDVGHNLRPVVEMQALRMRARCLGPQAGMYLYLYSRIVEGEADAGRLGVLTWRPISESTGHSMARHRSISGR